MEIFPTGQMCYYQALTVLLRKEDENVNCNQSFKSHADRKVNKELTTLFGYDVLLKGISHVLRVQTQCSFLSCGDEKVIPTLLMTI